MPTPTAVHPQTSAHWQLPQSPQTPSIRSSCPRIRISGFPRSSRTPVRSGCLRSRRCTAPPHPSLTPAHLTPPAEPHPARRARPLCRLTSLSPVSTRSRKTTNLSERWTRSSWLIFTRIIHSERGDGTPNSFGNCSSRSTKISRIASGPQTPSLPSRLRAVYQ